jgi:hypothetical protein
MQAHCHATKTGSCFHESLVSLVEFFENKIIPLFQIELGIYGFSLLEEILTHTSLAVFL